MKYTLFVLGLLVMAVSVAAAPTSDNPSIVDEFNLPSWTNADDSMDPLMGPVPYHTWRSLGNGMINGYQYDMDMNLLYVVQGVPGVAEYSVEMPNGHHMFYISEVPNNAKSKNGYVHFHPAAIQDEDSEGIEGYFLRHIAVTSGFEFPLGRMVEKQGVDFGFPNNIIMI